MKISTAVAALSALAQESRLAVFRLLVTAGPEGVCAGDLAQRLQLAPATLSFHLGQLSHAGLVTARQEGRYIYYSANFATMDGVIAFLSEDCCGGRTCLPSITPHGRPKRKTPERNS